MNTFHAVAGFMKPKTGDRTYEQSLPLPVLPKIIQRYIAWKVSKYGYFSFPYIPVFGLNTEIYGVNLRIFNPNIGKYGPDKTPHVILFE